MQIVTVDAPAPKWDELKLAALIDACEEGLDTDGIDFDSRWDSRELIEVCRALCEILGEDESGDAPVTPDLMALARATIAACDEFKAETSSAEFPYGIVFIPLDEFEEYAREFADEMGMLSTGAGWPIEYIDWPAAANALAVDYAEINIAGHGNFLFRA